MEAEVEKLTQAARYERNEQRQGCRSGHYSRNLTTNHNLCGCIVVSSPSRCPSSRGYPLRPLLLSGIVAGRAVWRRLSSRYTWQVYR